MKTTYPKQRYAPTARELILAISLALASALAGCGKPSSTPVTATDRATETTIEALFVDRAPDGALSVIESRQGVEAGTHVTVIGRVAGAKEPFSAFHATLVLADNNLTTCERRPDDSCETPWDACCEQPSTIANSRMSVQVVGSDGHPVGQTLKGVHGLSELDTLVISGTVAEGSTPENVILNATAIFRQDS